MPVTPELGVPHRDHDDVPHAGSDLLIASRADVLLARQIGLNALEL
ncbi:MAG: hypothetical protein ACYDGN_04235 [Acidimicrobiales bacterium]